MSKPSKTQEALRLMDRDGMTAYAAAKAVGITPTTLYVAIKRREAQAVKQECPCCGSSVAGFKVPDKTIAQVWGVRKQLGG